MYYRNNITTSKSKIPEGYDEIIISQMDDDELNDYVTNEIIIPPLPSSNFRRHIVLNDGRDQTYDYESIRQEVKTALAKELQEDILLGFGKTFWEPLETLAEIDDMYIPEDDDPLDINTDDTGYYYNALEDMEDN